VEIDGPLLYLTAAGDLIYKFCWHSLPAELNQLLGRRGNEHKKEERLQ
jgi:hypothetical protein